MGSGLDPDPSPLRRPSESRPLRTTDFVFVPSSKGVFSPRVCRGPETPGRVSLETLCAQLDYLLLPPSVSRRPGHSGLPG